MPFWVRTILVTAVPSDAEAAVAAHRAHLTSLRESGRLRIAGLFGRGDGYLDVFEADDLLAAEAIARQSPLVTEGLAAWTLRAWEEIID